MNNNEYKAFYYRNSQTNKTPVLEYIGGLNNKEKAKVNVYVLMLCSYGGYLDEPYSKYVGYGLRELRVDFSRNRHRIFYLTVEDKKIILLHAFQKKTQKTPKNEIVRALNNFQDYKNNKFLIEYEKK